MEQGTANVNRDQLWDDILATTAFAKLIKIGSKMREMDVTGHILMELDAIVNARCNGLPDPPTSIAITTQWALINDDIEDNIADKRRRVNHSKLCCSVQ